ncbi:hypothetical protein EGR_10761 [Echinococcus granulosus]|uniref:Uncharacterized protein n=1 Tax=Echinococcus granulosus TaxID=6210 RepID=W6U039_ECHGR|nr:hypothetical protein EGR_10761 [Echinococcus granulosus]EUB54383.1 hypothetical protein EGR_10761 [Echinococcus granulosus]
MAIVGLQTARPVLASTVGGEISKVVFGDPVIHKPGLLGCFYMLQ